MALGQRRIDRGSPMSTRRIVWLIGLAAFLASCSVLARNDDSSPTADNGAKLKRPAEDRKSTRLNSSH